MRIIKESDRIILKDYNFSSFVLGLAFIIMGSIAAVVGQELAISAAGMLFAVVGLYVILTVKIINIVLERKGDTNFQ